MAEKKPIPVRLSEDAIARLDKAAESMGSDRSALIRMLVTRWLDFFEKAGPDALPFDFDSIMSTLDGRTTAARIAEGSAAPPKSAAAARKQVKYPKGRKG